jgi:Tol biopolymer transport system component
MKKLNFIFNGLMIGLLLAGLAGCRSNQTTSTVAAANSGIPTEAQPGETLSAPAPEITQALQAGTTLSPTETKPAAATKIKSTATPDTRLPPDQWQKWPYVPAISARAIEIYKKGLAMGNDPHSFSIAGDCQSIVGAFLDEYDNPYGYNLDPAYNYLRDTVDYFKGSFGRDDVTRRGCFTAATILSPLLADQKVCKPGESPLTCEFRIHNPSILLITLEVGNPQIAAHYEMYLRQIIDKSIARGVLPVLATKADVAELGNGVHVMNPIIAKLAYEYDLPLWNWWRSAQPLDNHGIDATRDGFHITKDAQRLKSFVALQTLDAIRRAVAGLQATDGVTYPQTSASPTPTPAKAPAVLPTTQPLCDNNPDCVVFGLAENLDGDPQYQGVYWFDLSSGKMVRVAPAGYNLQSVSPDGKSLLINQDGHLLITPSLGGSLVKISDQFFNFSKQSAHWMADGKSIAWISSEKGKTTLMIYDVASASSKSLTTPDDRPMAVFPSPDSQGVYWQEGTCTALQVCSPEHVRYTGLDGKPGQALDNVIDPIFSPDGQSFAYLDPINNIDYLNGQFNDIQIIENIQTRLASRRLIFFPPAEGYEVRPRLVNSSWSPDNAKLLSIIDDHSFYDEKSKMLHIYVTDMTGSMVQVQYLKDKRLAGMGPQAVWSPDSKQVLLTLADGVKNPNFNYRVNMQLLNLTSGEVTPFDQVAKLISSNYIYITNIYWPNLKP